MPKKDTKYDLVVIGTGSAGLAAAFTARELGAKRVAVIEKSRRLGGECPNRGCVPTKALLRSVEILQLVRRAKEFGIQCSKPDFSFAKIMERKNLIVDRLTGNKRIEIMLSKQRITLIKGSARFLSSRRAQVGDRIIHGKKFVIATGSSVFVPPIPGLKKSGFITSDDAVSFKKLPKSILIVGGGPIGVETAQIYAPLGVKVVIVEIEPHVLPREDFEIAAVVARSLQSQGVRIFTEHKVASVGLRDNKQEVVVVDKNKKKKVLKTQHVMAATGKRANTEKLGLEKAGVEMDKRGNLVTNAYLQTSKKHIYAAGDVMGRMLFTHVAHTSGSVAGENAFKGNKIKYDFRVIPRGTFCTPEVGSVGLTEKEAKDQGYEFAVGRARYAGFGKSLVMGETEGLVKILVNKKTKQILGGHIVGYGAAELVHEIALAMQTRLSYTKIVDMIHAYPTFSEVVFTAAAGVDM